MTSNAGNTPAATGRRRAAAGRGLALLALLGAAYGAGRLSAWPKPLPEIAATLDGDESNFSSQLDRRLRNRFPAGSREQDLIDLLRREGFQPDWRGGADPNIATFLHRGVFCEQTVHVLWRADSSGVLIEVGGDYKSQCLS